MSSRPGEPQLALPPRASLWVLLFSALSVGGALNGVAGQQRDATFAEIQDTVPNPIRMGCGERVDPVGFVLFVGEDLQLAPTQVQELQGLAAVVRERNLPLAAAWRRDRSELEELRRSYQAAVAEIERILTPEQFQDALKPHSTAPVGAGRKGLVRCLFRSHLAIVR